MISVVICSRDDARFARVEAMYRAQLAGEAFEIVRIADARSMSEGYRRGIERSAGEILILSHDDIEIMSSDLAGKVKNHLAHFDVIGVAGTTLLVGPKWTDAGPSFIFGQVIHPMLPPETGYCVDIFGAPRRVIGGIQAMDGLFLAMRKDLFKTLQFDETLFDGFHIYDLDFTFRAFQAGRKLAVCNDICISHDSEGEYQQNWQLYAQRFVQKHRASIGKLTSRRFNWSFAIVPDRQSALQVMNPNYWDKPA